MQIGSRLRLELSIRSLILVVVVFCMGSWTSIVEASSYEWVSHGPYGGEVSTIAVEAQRPATVYAGTYGGGVFKSSNGGESWTTINNGLTNSYVFVVAVDPKTSATVYAGTAEGLFKSSNGGESWTTINSGHSRVVAVDPKMPATVYAGAGRVLLKTINGGRTWTAIYNVVTDNVVRALAIDPKTPTTVYAGTSEGIIIKTSDGGGLWTTNSPVLPGNARVYALAIDPQTPATVFAGTNNGVYKSTDGAITWTANNNGLYEGNPVLALAIDPQNPGTIYAGTGEFGIFKSTNGGSTWTVIDIGYRANLFTNAIAIDPGTTTTLYVGTEYGGVFKSTNGGNSWAVTNNGLAHTLVPALAIDPQHAATVWAGTMGDGVFKSADGGESWLSSSNGLTSPFVLALAVDPQDSTSIYAGVQLGGVFKSSNGGESWTVIKNGMSSYTSVIALAIDPQTSATVYAVSSEEGVFKSTNGGGSWTAVNSGLIASSVSTLAIDPRTPTTLYVGTRYGRVFKSTNGGGSWMAVSSGLNASSVNTLAIDPQTPATIYAGAVAGGVFKSTNGGGSWTATNSGLTNKGVLDLAIDPQMPDTLYAGTAGGVFKSINGGGSWTAINSGLANTYVWTLGVDSQNPSRIYAGTDGAGVHVYSPAGCSYSISPLGKAYSSIGATDEQLSVTTTSSCPWDASSSDSWLTIASGNTGSGNGVITFSVSPNPSSDSRTGAITIADQTFTVTQAGANPSFFISTISPATGPKAGGTAVTINGAGFQAGATIAIGSFQAAVNNVTSSQITATTGTASAAGTFDVVVTNPGGEFVVLNNGFTYLAGPGPVEQEIFVPIVLSVAGLNGSFFTSEMTLTNRGTGNATVQFAYTSSIGSGNGSATDLLAAGQQKVVEDAISYLRSLGIPIPSSGNQAGTLRVTFSGLSSSSDGGVTVRTTTAVPEGRAGLAYAGIPVSTALRQPSYICGLRQNQADRSNVAIQNVGSSSDGNITLRLTVFSGEGGTASPHVLPDQVLSPGGWVQISGILASNGLSVSNGYVRVERMSGTAPYYAYGVINDQVNSDGSFVPPILENSQAGRTGLSLPVIVETSAFNSELVLCNWSSTPKSLHFFYAGDAFQSEGSTASFDLVINAGEQRIIPNLVQWLRGQSGSGIGLVGPSYAGPLYATVGQGDINGIFLGARTSTPGGGGEYGLFYTSTPYGSASPAWLYGLRQDNDNRSNLAIVNTGDFDGNRATFDIELYDGSTGTKVNTIRGVIINAKRWFQIGSILGQYAPSTTQGYAHVIQTSGLNSFIAYAVNNDGAKPQERSGDGAYIASTP